MNSMIPRLYEPGSDQSPDWKSLVSLINDIKNTKMNDLSGINLSIKSIKKVLFRLTNKNFEVTILNNDIGDIFICNVYPTVLDCKKIVDLIIEENSNEIERIRRMWTDDISVWHMDLDSKLFFDNSMTSLDSEQIAVLILYNIERTIYSYDNITRVNYLVNKRFFNSDFTTNKLARSVVCRNLFLLPFINSCEFKNYYTPSEDNIRSGKLDGSFVLNGTFIEIYSSALTKLLCSIGSGYIDRTAFDFDNSIDVILDWLFGSICTLKYSTAYIKRDLKKVILTTKSYYTKNIFIDILLTFGTFQSELTSQNKDFVKEHFGDGAIVSDMAIENKIIDIENEKEKTVKAIFERTIKNILTDFLDSFGNIRRVTQKEIDILKIEVESVRNGEDKLYILEDLYDKISLVDYSLSALEDKETARKVKVTKQTLLAMQQQLQELRNSVMSKDIKPKQLGLFIKYPNGYEG